MNELPYLCLHPNDSTGDPCMLNHPTTDGPLMPTSSNSFADMPLIQMVVVLKELKESLDALNETLKQAAVKPSPPTHLPRMNGREY